MKRKDFTTNKEFFAYLIKNRQEIIALKKSAVKFAAPVYTLSARVYAEKIITTSNQDNEAKGVIKRTVIGNTYGWMDNHDDVHIPGIFTKSITENKNIMHLHDHIYQLTAKVGSPIKIYELNYSWSALGIDKAGYTTCLMMDSEIKKAYNEIIYDSYAKGEIDQHSVGMMYVKLFLCINDEEHKEDFANWNNYIGFVANREKAEEQGYFWAVTEAKLREISCVIEGSNELTPTIEIEREPDKPTPDKIEPEIKSTQEVSEINYEYLIQNLKL